MRGIRDVDVNVDVLLLSVKPAQIQEVLTNLNRCGLSQKTLLISVAAGTNLSKIENLLKGKYPVVRAMPNSPCSVQEGFTALCKGRFAKPKHIALAKKIFSSLGRCAEISEKHFDVVTALSGSGPAYFYYFMEAMIGVAIKNGLPTDQALELVTQTVLGAAAVVRKSNRSLQELTLDVATPGGCTAEALKVLDSASVAKTFSKAIEAATSRASILGRVQA